MDFFPDLGLLSFLERETSVLRESEARRSEAFTEPPPWLRTDAADGAAYLMLCALDPTVEVLQRDAVLACVRRLYQKVQMHLREQRSEDSPFDPSHFTGLSAAAWRCIAFRLQRTILLCDPLAPLPLVAYAPAHADADGRPSKCTLLLRRPEGGLVSVKGIDTVEDGIAHAKGAILESGGSMQALHARLDRMLKKDLEVLRHALGIAIPVAKASKSQMLQLVKTALAPGPA